MVENALFESGGSESDIWENEHIAKQTVNDTVCEGQETSITHSLITMLY